MKHLIAQPQLQAENPKQQTNLFLVLILVLLFSQVWFEVSGFTIRAEDILILLWLGLAIPPTLVNLRFKYYTCQLTKPLIFWGTIIGSGVVVSLISPYSSEIKKDALINGIRLILSLSLFFAVYYIPGSAIRKTRFVLSTIIGFSLLTTFAALLQIFYWDGWLPKLPVFLTTLKEGANNNFGKEIFALYLGDTATHIWSAMLAMQALTTWVVAINTRNALYKLVLYCYSGLLCFILIRTSVRNSILGLGIVFIGLNGLITWHSQLPWNRLLKPLLGFVFIAGLTLFMLTFAPDNIFVIRIFQVFPQLYGERIIIPSGSNIFGRLEAWQLAIEIFFDFPLLGGGFWSFLPLSDAYISESLVHVHNSYLQILAELGLVGAVGFVWLIWHLIKFMQMTWKNLTVNPFHRSLWLLTTGNLIFMGFTALFANPIWYPTQVGFCMILLGAIASFARE